MAAQNNSNPPKRAKVARKHYIKDPIRKENDVKDLLMKNAVRLNGWCFAGDERTVQTSLQKLTEKGFELQLMEENETEVGRLQIVLNRDTKGRLGLEIAVTSDPASGFCLKEVSLNFNGIKLLKLTE